MRLDEVTACLREKGLSWGRHPGRPDEAEVQLETETLAGVTLRLQLLGGGALLFDWRLPLGAPPGRCPAVCEYLTRVNAALPAGGFVLDLDGGGVSCRTLLLCSRGQFDPALFDRMFALGAGMIDRYAPGLCAVLFGGWTPRAACRLAGIV